MTVRVALAGAGAFGIKHLDALAAIDGVKVEALVGRRIEPTREVADRYAIEQATTELDEVLARPEIDAVILCTPTGLHAAQAIEVMRAGKHVQVEIPLADSWADAEQVARVQRETGRICMVGHTRRFNPPHQWIHRRIRAGELALHHLVAQTYFLRRRNLNALGQPRSWTDNLLWHHAAHTVDLFHHQTGERVIAANVLQGPPHPELGIAMDMSIQLVGERGALCTLALSFNNAGPLGSTFRYICDQGTYLARYDELCSGDDEPIDTSGVAGAGDGVELQDREFVLAIREGRAPEAAVDSVLDCYRVLGELAERIS